MLTLSALALTAPGLLFADIEKYAKVAPTKATINVAMATTP